MATPPKSTSRWSERSSTESTHLPQIESVGTCESAEVSLAADPQRIGSYRIIRRIGIGGMGIVYLAVRDDDQFRRRVAIKVIKRGMDSEAILRRFKQERQVLAALNHPNIARFFDGGVTEDGRPYFVMEYIEGQPMIEFCDKNRLGINDRLNQFCALCQAVHHAHQNLVVHRDLKPGNVVITKDAVLKLLDFGIAKLLNPDLAALVSEPTAPDQRVMTPEYASPEQVRGDPITTASDVYSLGVLLYELVSGRKPYRFKTRLANEIEHVICHIDPERPSTAVTRAIEQDSFEASAPRLTSSRAGVPDTAVEDIARVRDDRPQGLRRRLRGDIDNIVLKALRKEPGRRYASAEQLAEDIQRHLDGLPVLARSPTWRYRAGKFLGRHRAGAAAAIIIILILVGGIVATTRQSQIAQTERDRANEASRASERIRKLTADYYFGLDERLETVPQSLRAREAILSSAMAYLADLEAVVGNDVRFRPVLAEALARIGDIQGGLRSSNIGDTHAAIQSYDGAIRLWRESVSAPGDDQRARIGLCTTLLRRGDLDRRDGRLEQARMFHDEAYRTALEAARMTTDSEARRTLAHAQLTLGDTLRKLDRREEAAELYQASKALRYELWMKAPPGESAIIAKREYAVCLTREAELSRDDDDCESALRMDEECLRLREELARDNPANTRLERDLMWACFYVAKSWSCLRDLTKARQYVERAERIALRLEELEPDSVRAQTDAAAMRKARESLSSSSDGGSAD